MIYIYTRISTQGQADKGKDDKIDSIENQIKRCRGWLVANDFDDSNENLTVIQDKAISGSLPLSERPEGGPMFEALQEGDVLICYKLDRLFRNLYDSVVVSEQLRDRKIILVIMDAGGNVTDDILGKMYFTLLSLFAEFERKKTAERTKEGSDNRAAEGGFIGGPAPFGFRSVIDPDNIKRKILIEDEHEQRLIRILLKSRENGHSYESISSNMEMTHHVKKHSSTWMRIYDREILNKKGK